MLPDPNSSTESSTEASGQFTAPQKVATRQIAAANCAGTPRTGPIRQPNVAPIKKVGTISPPLKPADKVTAVKIIFNRKAAGFTSSV